MLLHTIIGHLNKDGITITVKSVDAKKCDKIIKYNDGKNTIDKNDMHCVKTHMRNIIPGGSIYFHAITDSENLEATIGKVKEAIINRFIEIATSYGVLKGYMQKEVDKIGSNIDEKIKKTVGVPDVDNGLHKVVKLFQEIGIGYKIISRIGKLDKNDSVHCVGTLDYDTVLEVESMCHKSPNSFEIFFKNGDYVTTANWLKYGL